MSKKTNDKGSVLVCSFCGKKPERGQKADRRTGSVYICDECIQLCSEIIEEEIPEGRGPRPSFENLMIPHEIKAIVWTTT